MTSILYTRSLACAFFESGKIHMNQIRMRSLVTKLYEKSMSFKELVNKIHIQYFFETRHE